ncbi:MAG TPA: hypothetical protein V6C58_07350 [Allocoleopsis sp.]
MTFFSLDEHTDRCHYPVARSFFFQYDYDFYCVFYCACYEGFQHLDWKLQLLKSVAKKVGKPEKFDKWGSSNITKSNSIARCIRDNKVAELLSSKVMEVCAVYTDNAGKEYCFGVEHDYKDFLSKNIYYEKNAQNAYKQCKEKGKELDIDFSEIIVNLQRYNNTEFKELSDIQKINLTKLLSKNFIKNYNNDYTS